MDRFYLIKTVNGCIVHDGACKRDFINFNLFELGLSYNECLELGQKAVNLFNQYMP